MSSKRENVERVEMTMADDNIELIKRTEMSWLIYFLVCTFGVGSWVAMNGIWMELPNLVNELPEGWSLPSYLTVICQLANLGPITYSYFRRKFIRKRMTFLCAIVYLSLTVGFLACVLLAFLWQQTAIILNKEVSIALFTLTFLVALVDCTSSVTFLPFMAVLPKVYMSPLYIGETLSGFLPSLVALAQGVVDKNNTSANKTGTMQGVVGAGGLRFPQEVFFFVLALMMLMCELAFLALNRLPRVRERYVADFDANESDNSARDTNETYNNRSESDNSRSETNNSTGVFPDIDYGCKNIVSTSKHESDAGKVEFLSSHDVILQLTVLMLLNAFQNGVVSSISSYAYAPYGTLTYHLAATLGSISSALSCFLFLWFPRNCSRVVYTGACLYSVFVVYIVLVASQVPTPWLKGALLGKIIMVAVSIISSALVSFVKLAIASVMREHGRKHLFWAGASNQIGSFVGAVIMFPIVNFTQVFNST